MPFIIIREDITKVKADIIVNSVPSNFVEGSGVDAAIYKAAGEKLLKARKLLGVIPIGDAFITPAFSLPSKYVIHTVGPVWNGGGNQEAKWLKQCYLSALKLALKNKCKSIAFPLISSGANGYPKDEAISIAKKTIKEFLENNEMLVYLVVYTEKSFLISKSLTRQVSSYINENLINSRYVNRRLLRDEPCSHSIVCNIEHIRSLSDLDDHLGESFSIALFRIIEEKKMSDVEVYKRANIDKKLFSKIRNNINYHPSKTTAVALALALRLNYDNIKDLIGRAGFALSNSNKFDLVIRYFSEKEIYDVDQINEVLFDMDLPVLGYF